MTQPDETELASRIRSSFPDLQWVDSELVTEGWDHAVIILDRRYVFRFPLEVDYERTLADEIALLRAFQPFTAVHIPKYRFIPEDVSFAGYEIVEGAELTLEHFNSEFSKHERIAQQLADFLTAFHTFESKVDALPSLAPFYVPAEQDEIRRGLREDVKPYLSDGDYALCSGILDEVDELITHQTWNTVVHGDIYSRHLLWDADRQHLGIIDFSDMGRGDPAIDFAELHEYGPTFVETVYSLYGAVKDDTFLARSWLYQKWVAVYMLTDHFVVGKTTFAVARETLDRVKSQMEDLQPVFRSQGRGEPFASNHLALGAGGS